MKILVTTSMNERNSNITKIHDKKLIKHKHEISNAMYYKSQYAIKQNEINELKQTTLIQY